MKITKKIEKEILAVMDDYWGSYLRGDLQTWASYLPDDYRNIGTTKAEIWNSKEEIVDFTESVIDQTVGMAETRNKKTEIIPYAPYFMVHELGDLFVKAEEGWVFYAQFRLSSLLEKTTDGWKILHQHGSYPDSKTEEGEAFAFDELKIENKKLKDAIQSRTIELERKNRELEIEAALERVRARTMAMQHSDELGATSLLLFDELKALGEISEQISIGIFDEEKQVLNLYATVYGEQWKETGKVDLDEPFVMQKIYSAWRQKEKSIKIDLSGKELKAYNQFRSQFSNLKFPKERWVIHGAFFSKGVLTFSTITPHDDQTLQLLERFAQVFDGTYTRFLDLQKAEAQAREAQIEAALERVRSRTMAMHKSSELAEAAILLFEQIENLGIETFASGFNIWDEAHENLISWMSNATGSIQPPFELPIHAYGQHKKIYKAWKKREAFLVHDIKGKALEKHYQFLRSFPLLNESFQEAEAAGIKIPDRQVHNIATFSNGYLLFITLEPKPEFQDIFQRFGQVFEQTYTRFLDLKKAEAQAREAQIEAALERVRSRTMAMQHSDELKEASTVLIQQVLALGIPAFSCGYNIFEKDAEECTAWMSTPDGGINPAINISLTEDSNFVRFAESKKQGEEFYVLEMRGADMQRHYQYLSDTIPVFAETFNAIRASGHSLPTTQIHHIVNFTYGNLMFITLEPCPEAHDIFKRFGKVFEQTYTRFLDLQKAEAQAQEAEIEAALEKIRSRSLAVNKSDEFNEVVRVVFEKLSDLDIPVGSVTIALNKKGTKDLEVYGCGEGDSGLSLIKFNLPYFPNALSDDILAAQRSAESGYFSKVYTEAEKNEYYEFAFKKTELKNLPDDLKEIVWQSKSYALSVAYTKNSIIMVNEFEGHVLNDDQANILKRISLVFEQSYIRFLDLQRSEAQAREAQIETALERVRSRSLAMHKASELGEVITVIVEQLRSLDFPVDDGVALITYIEGSKDLIEWMENPGFPTAIKFHLPYFDHPVLSDLWKAKESGADFIVTNYSAEDSQSFLNHIFEHSDFVHTPQEIKDYCLAANSYGYTIAFQKNTSIFINDYAGYKLTEDEIDILKRFSKVFEQAYTRFLDLQKAEAQAREAQIEAAVERVRAEAMAMHSTADFEKVTKKLLHQVETLQVEGLTGASILLIENNEFTWWDFSSPGKIGDPLSIFYKYDARQFKQLGKKVLDKLKEGEPYFVLEYDLDMIHEAAKEWEQIDTNIANVFKKAISDGHLTYQWNPCGRLSNGLLAFDMIKPPDDDVQKITVKMTHAFEQAYIRFLDLQKAEAQARENKIQLSLERVRASAMSMHNSEDLSATIQIFYEEFVSLSQSPIIRCGSGVIRSSTTIADLASWSLSPKNELVEVRGSIDMMGHPLLKGVYNHWEQQKEYTHILRGNEIKEYYMTMRKQVNIPDYPTEACQHSYFHMFPEGSFYVFTEQPLLDQELSTFRRFSSVLSLTYRRYHDLKKAEAQAREKEIELGLERVRARAMAMRTSDELSDLVKTVFDELTKLDFAMKWCMINIINEATADNEIWAVNPDVDKPPMCYNIKFGDWPYHQASFKAYQERKSQFVYVLEGKEKEEFDEFMFNETDVAKISEEAKAATKAMERYVHSYSFSDFGGLQTVSEMPLSEENLDILARFGKVFDLTYTRFNDLKLAEAQAREAQIEAALERVRAQSMMMQHSVELKNVSNAFHEQLLLLGLPTELSYVWLPDETSMIHQFWATWSERNKKGIVSRSKAYSYPLDKSEPYTASCYEMWESDENVFVKRVRPEEVKDFFATWAELIGEVENLKAKNFPEGLYYAEAYMKYGCFGINIRRPLDNAEEDVLLRFAIEFERTYTRFLDLKKAEAQAREAQIEVALEKVRSRTMAMHSPEELQEVVAIVAEKLQNLGVILDANGAILCTYFENSRDVMHWISAPDFSGSGKYLLPYFDHPIFSAAWESKMSGADYFSQSFPVEEKNSFFEYAFEHSDYKYFPEEFKEWVFQNDKHSLSFAWSKNSAILIPSHTGVVPNETDIEILKRFAKVFEQAYIRFMDLQTKEVQAAKILEEKQRLEETLHDLQLTQKQLIQSEKMASLGELTAGIAHEIQNPLNFVNNFSEVSHELLDEMNEEIENGDLEEARAIANDIKQNLEKINHHGKRADAIVKGMLQHSRKSGAEKTLTDLNQLADEYLRLAYHGLRAKDKSFNATLKTDFDPALEKIMVIPQDIGRVILNLITNAFYAVSEKKKNRDNGFEPTVEVSTKKLSDHFTISVKDNGDGIPKQVLDKIFQPFFTTKPTGQGTGLGLSLSYDIIKAHEGKLEVETREGSHTIFKIILPKTKISAT